MSAEPRQHWVVYNFDGPLISFDTEEEARWLADRLWPVAGEGDAISSPVEHVMPIYHYGLED